MKNCRLRIQSNQMNVEKQFAHATTFPNALLAIFQFSSSIFLDKTFPRNNRALFWIFHEIFFVIILLLPSGISVKNFGCCFGRSFGVLLCEYLRVNKNEWCAQRRSLLIAITTSAEIMLTIFSRRLCCSVYFWMVLLF